MIKRLFYLLSLLPILIYASTFSEAMRAYKQSQYEKAKTLFETALEEEGALQAQYFLGLLYLKGQGTKTDISLAQKYLLKATQMGNARAKCYLAETYLLLSKKRVKSEKKKIRQLLRDGANEGAQECKNVASKYKISL